MLKETQVRNISQKLERYPQIVFAYLHGSSLSSAEPHDIDIAVFLYPEYVENPGPAFSYHLDFALPLEQEIGNSMKAKIDIQILNRSPLPFRFRVVSKGIVLLDRNFDMRERFELLSRVEYFDFRPRRQEYIKEAFV